jgi:pilus assembly protein TadC
MVLLLLASAVCIWPRSCPNRRGRQNLRWLGPPDWFPRFSALVAGLAAALWSESAVVLLIVTGPAWVLLPRIAASRNRVRTESIDLAHARALPDVLILMAALVRSGSTIPMALSAAGQTAPGELGRTFANAAREASLGESLNQIGRELGEALGQKRVGMILARAADSGTAIADQFEGLAKEARRDYVTVAHTRAKQAGVRIVLPLGLCLLPAFVALGVVPMVAALLTDVTR